MGFGEFLRTRLFEPLGMRDTAFWVPSDKTERFASCYQPETGGGAPISAADEFDTAELSPAFRSLLCERDSLAFRAFLAAPPRNGAAGSVAPADKP
jgi:CubicO group peptidase (beta-lactamase class C family)